MDEADLAQPFEQFQGGQHGSALVEIAVPLTLDTEDATTRHVDLPVVARADVTGPPGPENITLRVTSCDIPRRNGSSRAPRRRLPDSQTPLILR
ncbi:hypothetical protein Vlu01_04680 [Micromonospora lutea]|uniref:Uncharacterized protein n=1 Tax=Micromonospora lutea TaxID=419825 RepID=A0ABQ4IPK4_9ACTN|nr:hypothetical protein Vlu01_04680 [Micromonospora lutea]